ncbi:hypothetical protein MMC17_000377 [Xylographa soralifera]|nr:hypothetical protein [Xylographa soralifera]
MADPSQPPPLSPEYLNQDLSGQLLAATTIILIFATALFVLRLYARSLTKAKWGWDDFLLPPAWILLVALCVTGYLSVTEGGAGRHVEAVVIANPGTLVTRGKIVYAVNWFNAYSNTFSRISVVALYLRIFTTWVTRVSSWLVLAYLLALVAAQTFAGALECRPISYFWDLTVPGSTGACFNQFLFYKINGILNIFGDVMIIVLPLHTIATLHTSSARKVGIAAVFLSGSVGIVAACLWTNSFFGGQHLSLKDPTYADISLISWTIVESGMYLAAACLVGLRPLYSVLPYWFKTLMTHNKSRTTWNMNYGRSTIPTGDDRDSITHMVKGADRKVELYSFDQDMEQGIDNHYQGGEIRVDSVVRVTTNGGNVKQKNHV